MMEDIANVGSAFKRILTIWVAAISLLNIVPAIIYAQVAKPPSAGKARHHRSFISKKQGSKISSARSSRGKSPASRWCKPTSTESAPTTACVSRP